MNVSPLLIIILIGSITALGSSQVQTEWVARYNGPGNGDDIARAIAVDTTGSIYVTGYSEGGATSYDYATIKYHPSGDTAWVRRYNGPGNGDDKATAMVVDNSGNVYITGSSVGTGTYSDYSTIKYDLSGDTEWVRRYNGLGDSIDEATAIAVDNSGNVYVTGRSFDGPNTLWDYLTVKYNAAGDTQWIARYDGPGNDDDLSNDKPNAIAVDNAGNVYVTGLIVGLATGIDYATIKYNPSGDTEWVRHYNDPRNEYDEATAIALDKSGNVYVTGKSIGFGALKDFLTIKYSASGDSQWIRRYDGRNAFYYPIVIALDSSGNVYITGPSVGENADYATIKYNPSGDTEWVRRYYGPENGYDISHSIAVDNSGNVYVTGGSFDNPNYNSDYATVKYNAAGDTQWTARYAGSEYGDDVASAIALNKSGNAYITGYSANAAGNYDYTTIKYSQNVGVAENTNLTHILAIPTPNPCSAPVTIRYSKPLDSQATIKIFDATGMLVRTLNGISREPAVTNLVWDGKDSFGKPVPAGVYFIRLETPTYQSTKKFVLVR